MANGIAKNVRGVAAAMGYREVAQLFIEQNCMGHYGAKKAKRDFGLICCALVFKGERGRTLVEDSNVRRR